MWRASTKLRCFCRVQTGPVQRCGLCTPASSQSPAAAAAAAKGSQPPMTQPPPPETPKQPPPPPPPSGGGGGAFFKLLGLSMVGAGGVIGYAWYDAKFKKQLEDNVPGAKSALDVIFPYLPPVLESEKPNTKPAITKPVKLALPQGTIVADPAAAQKEGLARVVKVADPVVKEVKLSPEELKKKEAAEKKAAAVREAAEKKEAEKREAERKAAEKKDMVQRVIQEKEAEEAADNAALESILSDLVGETATSCQAAMQALQKAADATMKHAQLLKAAMDEEAEGEKKDEQWNLVSEAHEEKLRLDHKVDGVLIDAKETLEKLHAAVKDGRANKVTRKNKAINGAESSYSQMSYDLHKSEADLERSKAVSRGINDYRDLMKKSREHFRKELESVQPDVRIGRRVGGRMTEEELNILIAHAHRRIEQLQKQVAEFQAMEAVRLDKALQRKEAQDEALAKAQLAREIEHLKGQFEVEKNKLSVLAEAECERDIRHQLTRQAAAHSDHLAQVVTVQKEELQKKYEQLLHDEVVAERDNIREEIAGWVSRLRGIEAAIEGRAEMEKMGRKAQELWLACQTFVNIIETGKEGADSWEESLKPLTDDIKAIREAGNDHPFVNALIDSIPKDAVDRGVWTKDNLIDRFEKVQQVCRRVAMIDDSGATLFKYFVSYLQSMLVFNQKPLGENDEIDPTKMSPFMLVHNARHCLERGDLEQAVRYVNQLEGEPRKVAQDWLKEARLLLETKQAAEGLLAHASAAGLGSLF